MTQAQINSEKAQALSLFKASRLNEAAGAYARLCEAHPEDADNWFLRGIVSAVSGRMPEACEYLRKNLSIRPKHAPGHVNLGNALLALNQLEEAKGHFQQAIKLEPRMADAWFNLGNLLARQQQFDTAAQHFQRASAIAPQNPVYHVNLAQTLQAAGHLEQANACYVRAIKLGSKLHSIFLSLSRNSMEMGRLTEAMGWLQRLLAIDPAHPEAYNNLGLLLQLMGNPEGAIQAFEKSRELAPADWHPLHNLANVLSIEGLMDKAQACFEQLKGLPNGEYPAIAGLSDLAAHKKDYHQAHALLRPYLEHPRPDLSIAAAYSVIAPRLGKTADAIQRLESALGNRSVHDDANPVLRTSAMFQLGRLHDSIGEYDKAFDCYRRGNDAIQRNYDTAEEEQETRRCMDFFTEQRMSGLEQAGNTSEYPVFVVGMPRSGTTLIEQILDAHPAASGTGELRHIGRMVKTLTPPGTTGHYTARLAQMSASNLDHMANEYLRKIQDAADPIAIRAVDKMPHNFMYIGVISMLFPRARIIHAMRNPLDTCLSIYFQNFASAHNYAYRLEYIAHQYQQYWRMMDHWGGISGPHLLNIRYEEMVAEPEGQTGRLLEFLGLRPDVRCLRFFETKRVVRTASRDQVRRPIYNTSVERWRHYEKHLAALIEPLKPISEQYRMS